MVHPTFPISAIFILYMIKYVFEHWIMKWPGIWFAKVLFLLHQYVVLGNNNGRLGGMYSFHRNCSVYSFCVLCHFCAYLLCIWGLRPTGAIRGICFLQCIQFCCYMRLHFCIGWWSMVIAAEYRPLEHTVVEVDQCFRREYIPLVNSAISIGGRM